MVLNVPLLVSSKFSNQPSGSPQARGEPRDRLGLVDVQRRFPEGTG